MELQRIVHVIDLVEGWAGAFLGTCLTFGIVCVGALALFTDQMLAISGPMFGGIVLLIAASLESPFLWRLWKVVLKGEFPVGPAVARNQPDCGLILSVPIAIWWGCHFAAGILGIVSFALVKNPPTEMMVAGFMMMGLSVAGNVFLALALKALTNSDDIVSRFWQHRFVLDGLVTGTAFIIAQSA